MDSKKVVKHYKMTLLSMPDVVSNYLNELHARDYDLENQEPQQELLEFRIGNRVLSDDTLAEPMDPERQYEVYMNRIINDYARVRRETTITSLFIEFENEKGPSGTLEDFRTS